MNARRHHTNPASGTLSPQIFQNTDPCLIRIDHHVAIRRYSPACIIGFVVVRSELMRAALARVSRLTRIGLFVSLGIVASCVTVPPPENPDMAGMLDAAVIRALLHVKDHVPAGTVALDTVNLGIRRWMIALAARHNFEVGDIRQLIHCDYITGECLLRNAAGPAIVIMLRPPARGYSSAARTQFPTIEVDVHWRRGAPTSRQLAGQIIEVDLEWTPRGGWVAFDSRTAWKLH